MKYKLGVSIAQSMNWIHFLLPFPLRVFKHGKDYADSR